MHLGTWVPFADVRDASRNPQGFADSFLTSGLWALPLLVGTVALAGLSTFLTRRVRPQRYRHLTVWNSVFAGAGYAFVNPFDGLRAPFTDRPVNDLSGIPWFMSKAYSIIDFCWAIALIAYLALGLIAVAT